MNWMTSFLPLSTAQVLGWTLIHSLWQAGLLAAAFGLFQAFPARIKAALSYGAVLLTVGLAVATFCWQLNSLPAGTPPGQYSSRVETLTADFTAASAPTANSAIDSLYGLLSGQMPVIVWLWLLGVVVATVRLGGSVHQLHRLRRDRHSALPAFLHDRLHDLQRRFALSRPVQLLGSRRISSPIVFGHLRPVILFPITLLSSVPADQVEALLAHELAHIKRHDYLLNLLLRMIRTLFFFNPGLLWLARSWETEREYHCDRLTTEIGVKAHSLAQALLGIREKQLAWLSLTPAALGRGALRERIQRIFGDPVRHRLHAGAGLPLLLSTLIAVLCLLGTPLKTTASEALFGLDPLYLQDEPAEVTPPRLTVVDKDLKTLTDRIETLRLQIEKLRRKPADPARNVELSRLEKQFDVLAKTLVARIPELSLLPPPVSVPEPAEPPAPPTRLDEEQKRLERIQELQKRELAELSEQQARMQAAQQAEANHLQEELERSEKEVLVKQREETERMNRELEKMNRELNEEQERWKKIEADLSDYLLQHKLIRTAKGLDIEIRRDRVTLAGKPLGEPHRQAVLNIVAAALGKELAGAKKIVINQR